MNKLHKLLRLYPRTIKAMATRTITNIEVKNEDKILLPNSTVRGQKDLDREAFKKSIAVSWLKIESSLAGKVVKPMKKYLLKMENLKSVQDHAGNASMKRLLLNPQVVKKFDDIAERERDELQKFGVTSENFENSDLVLTYENWKADDIFKAVLPEDNTGVAGYSIIGHIVHLNLRDHLLEYKNVIGQVLMDKIKGCQTVVNKLDIIDNTYRNFAMEVLAGEENMVTKTKENSCQFEFDFSEVYWNPRLSTEHERITNMLQGGDVLYDVFAGVGPFAVPAARRRCRVLANDLNPHSYKWLVHNAKLNKVSDLVQASNMDGREFIQKVFAPDYIERIKSNSLSSDSSVHIVMNLPAIAVTFLDSFIGLFSDKSDLNLLQNAELPFVHVYMFSNDDDPHTDARKKVESILNFDLPSCKVNFVRNVAPKKEMMRVDFQLTYNLLTNNLEPASKRQCIDKL